MSVFRDEGLRKLFHAFSALYAGLYAFWGRGPFLWGIGTVLAGATVLEAVRLRRSDLNRWLVTAFGGIHRDRELVSPSGIYWTLLGSFVVAAVVPHRDIVIAALLYLTVGDGLAGWVGRNWGRIRLGNKSLEGSLAAFLGCWAVGAAVLTPVSGRPEVLWGALLAAGVEALDLPPDDNLMLPVISGAGLWALRSWA